MIVAQLNHDLSVSIYDRAITGEPLPPNIIAPCPDEFASADTAFLTHDGAQILWRSQAEIDAIVAARAAAFEASELIRKNTPIVYDQPLESPLIVFIAHTSGKGIGLFADDDNTILQIEVHASPMPSPEEIERRKNVAKAAHKAAKDDAESKRIKAKSDVESAQNVPALRAAVLSLQAQIDSINARIK